MVKPTISVIIANRNGAKFLIRCLSSIFVDVGNYEVILVDDGSDDASVEIVKSHFGKKSNLKLIVLDNNLGAAKARNMGVVASRGKYLLFLDSDTKISQGWYKKIVDFFHSQPKAGAAQLKLVRMGTAVFDYAGDYVSPLGFLIERAREARDSGQFDKVEPIFSGKSAAMIVRRKVFDLIGGFDEDYQIFWEDTDLAWRVWLSGFQVCFAHAIKVGHAYGTKERDGSSYVLNRVYYRGCRNAISTLIKNLEAKNLIRILLLNSACWMTLSLMALVKLDVCRAFDILKGMAWNLVHIRKTLAKRYVIQARRRLGDDSIFKLVGRGKEAGYYFGKAIAYLTNKPY